MNNKFKIFIAKASSLLPDRLYIELRYFLTFRKKLNINNPKTYNEKLQWMKLKDRNPKYHELVDKEEVKKYVEHLNLTDVKTIPTLHVWDTPEDIDVTNMPDKFVLKCTHDSGSVRVYHDKKDFNRNEAIEYFNTRIKRSQYKAGREWAYKGIKPRIIAEPYMHDDITGELRDYKFFCFNGKVKAMFIATDRGKIDTDVKFDFFDEHFNHLPIRHGHENATQIPQKPMKFDEMKCAAEHLSRGLRAVRVDLYEINREIYFGEYTFYHHCGFVPFCPNEWDYTFGQWLNISDD